MRSVLLEMEISGVKCLSKPLSIRFASINHERNDSFLKAIYGQNGAGKTAIVLGCDLYSKFARGDISLDDSAFCLMLSHLINKTTLDLKLSFTFHIYDEHFDKLIRHSLSIGYDEFNSFCIKSEEVFLLDRRGKGKCVYSLKDGTLSGEKNLVDYLSPIKIDFSKRSVVPIAMLSSLKRKEEAGKLSEFQTLYFLYFSALSMNAYFGENSDVAENILWKNYFNDDEKSDGLYRFAAFSSERAFLKGVSSNCFDVIFSKQTEDFIKESEGLLPFLRIAKPDLKDINIKFIPNGELSVVELSFLYEGDYEVAYEFESTGIKKMIHLYFALKSAKKGNIVFIDEIDSDLHDSLLSYILSYFAKQENIQIIMTTHNVELMSILKGRKNAIDFLSLGNKIVSWANGGRRNPAHLYLKGYIPGIPLNNSEYKLDEIFGE